MLVKCVIKTIFINVSYHQANIYIYIYSFDKYDLFIINLSAHVLLATHRFDPSCEPDLNEVLNQKSIHCR